MHDAVFTCVCVRTHICTHSHIGVYMYAHTFTTIANVYSHGFMGRSNAWSPRHAMLCVAASFIDVFWFNVCLRVLRDELFVRDLSMLFIFVVFFVFLYVCFWICVLSCSNVCCGVLS